jgi:glutamine amidotransferase
MIGVLDYGVGNIASILNILKKTGAESMRVKSSKELDKVSKIILPGVGSFDYGMECLKASGLLPKLNELVLNDKIPTLGICLGMQLMCLKSEEGKSNGLGWIDAQVRKFDFQDEPSLNNLKVPHMGWNEVICEDVQSESFFFHNGNKARFYFVHSYFVECKNSSDIMVSCSYGKKFVAGFRRDNIIGVQFHPEKSHKFGLKLLEEFANQNVKK